MLYRKLGLAAVIAAALAANAHAEFYTGAGLGWTNPKDSDFDTSYGIKLTGGYNFMENLSAEISYVDLGEFDAGAGTLTISESGWGVDYGDSATSVDVNSATLDIAGFDVSAVGRWPINEQFSAFGRLGMFIWDADLEVDLAEDGEGGSIPGSDDGIDLLYGAGVAYHIDEFWSVSGEWTNFKAADGDITYLGAAVKFHFR